MDTTEQLAKRLSTLINESASITLRNILHRIPSESRTVAEEAIKNWAAQGLVTLSGTGRKGSPITVSNPLYQPPKEQPRCDKLFLPEGTKRKKHCRRFPEHIGPCAVKGVDQPKNKKQKREERRLRALVKKVEF